MKKRELLFESLPNKIGLADAPSTIDNNELRFCRMIGIQEFFSLCNSTN